MQAIGQKLKVRLFWSLKWVLSASLILFSPVPLVAEEAETSYEMVPRYFETSIFEVSAAEAQEILAGYSSLVWNEQGPPAYIEQHMFLQDRFESLRDDILTPDLEANLDEPIKNMMLSYTVILFLSRNGYIELAEREMFQFLKAVLKFNSSLDLPLRSETRGPIGFRVYSHLEEDQREVVIERVFQELDDITESFRSSMQLRPQQRDQMRFTLESLGRRVFQSDFSRELKVLEREYLNQGWPSRSTLLAPALVAGAITLGGLFGFENSSLEPYEFAIGLTLMAAIYVGLTVGATQAIARQYSPWHARVEQLRSIARRCSQALRDPGFQR